MPPGTEIQPIGLDVLALRRAGTASVFAIEALGGCTAYASRKVLSNDVVPERIPENLPVQPRQYLAPSRLGVWHASQNFVIRSIQVGQVVYGMGMNFVMTTSKLITTQKAAKSNPHDGACAMRVCLVGDIVSPEFLTA